MRFTCQFSHNIKYSDIIVNLELYIYPLVRNKSHLSKKEFKKIFLKINTHTFKNQIVDKIDKKNHSKCVQQGSLFVLICNHDSKWWLDLSKTKLYLLFVNDIQFFCIKIYISWSFLYLQQIFEDFCLFFFFFFLPKVVKKMVGTPFWQFLKNMAFNQNYDIWGQRSYQGLLVPDGRNCNF